MRHCNCRIGNIFSNFLFSFGPSEQLLSFLMYIGLGMLVAIGAYIDVFRSRGIGLTIIVLSSLILGAIGLLAGSIFYTRNNGWWGSPILLPSITAIMTLIMSLLCLPLKRES
jgi:hypothetical protein